MSMARTHFNFLNLILFSSGYPITWCFYLLCVAQFASLDWSPCEEKLLYIAEKKMDSSTQKSFSSANDVSEEVTKENSFSVLKHKSLSVKLLLSVCVCVAFFQDKNVYRDDWGEGFEGKSVPVLCVADLTKGEVIVSSVVPPHVSPGQVSQI